MRTYKKEYRKVPDRIICDICGSNCTDDNCGDEYASLEAMWGYCSKKDGTKHDIHLCECCFDHTIQWLKLRRDTFNYVPDMDSLNGLS